MPDLVQIQRTPWACVQVSNQLSKLIFILDGMNVFAQAKPLQFNWRFLELLQSPTRFGTVQALAGQSIERGTRMKTDRISTRTLNSVLIHNPESVDSAKWFSKDYNLTWGQNLVKKYFDMIGLENWMDERQEVRPADSHRLLSLHPVLLLLSIVIATIWNAPSLMHQPYILG